MSNSKAVFHNEEAAEYRTNIEGWACKTCHFFYGKDGERAARYCCEKDHACGADGCAGRAEKPYIYCPSCNRTRDLQKWQALPEVDWDGETPLCLDDDDTYFFSADDLDEYLADKGVKLEDIRLVICEKESPPCFEMDEFLCDHLADNMDCPDAADIEKAVEDWIKKNVPDVWFPAKMRPSEASIRKCLATEAA
jgi:hypothetical protein